MPRSAKNRSSVVQLLTFYYELGGTGSEADVQGGIR